MAVEVPLAGQVRCSMWMKSRYVSRILYVARYVSDRQIPGLVDEVIGWIFGLYITSLSHGEGVEAIMSVDWWDDDWCIKFIGSNGGALRTTIIKQTTTMVKSRPLEYRRFSWCRRHCTTIVSLSHEWLHSIGAEEADVMMCLIFWGGFVEWSWLGILGPGTNTCNRHYKNLLTGKICRKSWHINRDIHTIILYPLISLP